MLAFEMDLIVLFTAFFASICTLNIDSVVYQATFVLPFFTFLFTGIVT